MLCPAPQLVIIIITKNVYCVTVCVCVCVRVCSDVTEKQCTQSGACVMLTVMDHDVISSNDLAGEVCIGLQQVLSSQSMGSSALLPLNLPIVNYDAPPTTVTGTSTSSWVVQNSKMYKFLSVM